MLNPFVFPCNNFSKVAAEGREYKKSGHLYDLKCIIILQANRLFSNLRNLCKPLKKKQLPDNFQS